jgi:hypothetical protein
MDGIQKTPDRASSRQLNGRGSAPRPFVLPTGQETSLAFQTELKRGFPSPNIPRGSGGVKPPAPITQTIPSDSQPYPRPGHDTGRAPPRAIAKLRLKFAPALWEILHGARGCETPGCPPQSARPDRQDRRNPLELADRLSSPECPAAAAPSPWHGPARSRIRRRRAASPPSQGRSTTPAPAAARHLPSRRRRSPFRRAG